MEEIISLSLFLSNFQLLIDKLRILSKIKRHNRKKINPHEWKK